MNREQIMKWIAAKANVPMGSIPPKWMTVTYWALFPGRIVTYLAAKCYSPNKDAFFIEGQWVSREFFASLGRGPFPGRWFRVIGNSPDFGVQLEPLVPAAPLTMVPSYAQLLAENHVQRDMLETAWGVIANAGHPSLGDWEGMPDGWLEAAQKWRDQWRAYTIDSVRKRTQLLT